MRPQIFIVASCMASLWWTGTGLADSTREIRAAGAYAGMAASSDNPRVLRLHLQHVLGCLEGSDEADATPAAKNNPCKKLGAGAIHDVSPDKQAWIRHVLTLTKQALQEDDFVKAKQLAETISVDLHQ